MCTGFEIAGLGLMTGGILSSVAGTFASANQMAQAREAQDRAQGLASAQMALQRDIDAQKEKNATLAQEGIDTARKHRQATSFLTVGGAAGLDDAQLSTQKTVLGAGRF